MKNFLVGFVFCLFANSAFAVPMLDVQGGQLMGATGVDVDGTLYDVSFQDGSCVGLFDGCDSVADFVFQTEASALSAANALLSSVFVDGSAGLFDTMPSLINGCDDNSICSALTPFSPKEVRIQITTLPTILVSSALNRSNVDGRSDVFFANSNSPDRDFSIDMPTTWAVWSEHVASAPDTAAVPVPSSLALFALGLAGLGLSRNVLSSNQRSMGVIIIGEPNTIVLMNGVADQILSRKDGLCGVGGQLSAHNPEDNRKLQDHFREIFQSSNAKATGFSKPLTIHRNSLSSPYEISLTPLTRKVSAVDDSHHLVLVMVHDPGQAIEESFRVAQSVHGLTKREALLVNYLCRGFDVEQMAEATSTSINTVRTHIKSVLRKTDTNSQAQLVAKMYSNFGLNSSIFP